MPQGPSLQVPVTLADLRRPAKATDVGMMREGHKDSPAGPGVLDAGQLAAIIQSSQDAIMSYRPDGTVVSWNPGAERLFGYSAQEMHGLNRARLVPEALRVEAEQAAERALGGEHVPPFCSRRIRKDGSMVEVSINLSPLRDADDTIVGYCCIAHDATLEAAADRELRRAYDEMERRVAERTVELAAVNEALRMEIVERDRSEQRLVRAERALRTLSLSNQTLVRATDEGAFLNEVCRIAVEEGGYFAAWVAKPSDDGSHFVPWEVHGIDADVLAEVFTLDPARPTLAAIAIESKEPVVLQRLEGAPYSEQRQARMMQLGVRSAVVLPLLAQDGGALGVLGILSEDVDAFDAEEMPLLGELAFDLAYGISALRLGVKHREAEEGLRDGKEQLERMVLGVVQAMGRVVEARDPYTSGHEERVAEIAEAIAREMGLDDDTTQAIRMAGLLHDIGKIRVPAEILTKPGRLTDVEFSLIREHSKTGADILGEIDFPWPVATIVRQHHERTDGSGYPDGLSGDDILLEARIIAVADTVEAIASHRPYRPARTVEEALAELGDGYDPQATAACVRLYESGRLPIK